MILVAMHRPVARVISNELNGLRRSGRHADRRVRPPPPYRNLTSIRFHDPPAMTVKMNGVTIHAEVGKTETNSFTQLHHDRFRPRPDTAVEGKDIEVSHD